MSDLEEQAYARGFHDAKEKARLEGRLVIMDSPELAALRARIDELEAMLQQSEAMCLDYATRAAAAEAKLATARDDALEEAAQELDCGCDLSRSLACGMPDLCPKINVEVIRAMKGSK